MASSAREIQLNELRDTISQLKETIAEQNELIRSLRDRLDEKTNHEKQLQEQIDYLTKKLFGTSSEKRSGDIPGQQNLFDEAEVEQDPSQEEIQEETIIHEHTRKKKGTHQDFFKGMEIEKVVIPLPKEEKRKISAEKLAENRNNFFMKIWTPISKIVMIIWKYILQVLHFIGKYVKKVWTVLKNKYYQFKTRQEKNK